MKISDTSASRSVVRNALPTFGHQNLIVSQLKKSF